MKTVSDSEGYNYTFVVCGNLSSSHCGHGGVGESVVLHTSMYNCSVNRPFLRRRHYLLTCLLNAIGLLPGGSSKSTTNCRH